MERSCIIYLPPDYDVTNCSYPVLYLLHGSGDDLRDGYSLGRCSIASKAVAEGKAGTMIIVMPDANTGTRGYFNAVTGKFNYKEFFFNELTPHIEKTYRVDVFEKQNRCFNRFDEGCCRSAVANVKKK